MRENRKAIIRKILNAALDAVDPYKAVLSRLAMSERNTLLLAGKHYRLDDYERIVILGAGKAGHPMAKACEQVLQDRIDDGILIVKHGHGGRLNRIRLFEGSHPLPSSANASACRKLLELAESCNEKTLVILLVSGGGSALLPSPVDGITLEDKLSTTRSLLSCGAAIAEINCIRKHLSAVKGGGLARALAPADVVALILSDVNGDRLDAIASGPVSADPTTFADAWSTVQRYNLEQELPAAVINHLKTGLDGGLPETLKPGAPQLKNVRTVLVGTNRLATRAAVARARSLGFTVRLLSCSFEGEADELAGFFLALGREQSLRARKRPYLFIGGGETTVTIKGNGRGGRNQQFALASVAGLSVIKDAFALGFATDGTDGPTDAAGAIADSQTSARAARAGLSPEEHLQNNNAYEFFSKLGDLIKTGPTGTNVCDLYMLGLW